MGGLIMEANNIPMGYVINQYQYARRYRYNSSGCNFYFNHIIDSKMDPDNGKYESQTDYLTFGEFDLLEIINVDSFRKYHDVSEMAKKWLGKRQSVLLYDISDSQSKTRIFFDKENGIWKDCKTDCSLNKKFFCLSMLSLTNEISEGINDISLLFKKIRNKILGIVDQINSEKLSSIDCEIFGTFNTAEIGIVWMSDQYIDILRVLDSIKHIKIVDLDKKSHPVFFASYSTIAIKKNTSNEQVKGNALVQIAIHDITDKYEHLLLIAKNITGICNEEELNKITSHSVGEYDLVIEVPASRAIQLIGRNGYLCAGKRKENSGKYSNIDREVLRNNIRLLYNITDVFELNTRLIELDKKNVFIIEYDGIIGSFTHEFEYKELIDSLESNVLKSNEYYYNKVRQELKDKVSSSAGAVDTLDLLYTDYKSVIASAYSAIWVSDLHRQFKSVLKAIDILILDSDDLPWSWESFHDITNAFKQQIYHLSQSSRMFFEIPACHLRATGQYDYLMHAYYGVTKQIIETIYLMQGNDAQSELVPLITVNTVPQVKSQLYFEMGDSDEMRTINLDIPNSIIFDPLRGIRYLTHELFHYAVPQNRSSRNYHMGLLFMTLIFKKQILCEIWNLLVTGIDLPLNNEITKVVNSLFATSADSNNGLPKSVSKYLFNDIEVQILDFIKTHYEEDIKPYISDVHNNLCSVYQSEILKFCLSTKSDALFEKLFRCIFLDVYLTFPKIKVHISEVTPDELELIQHRLEYCQKNSAAFDSYIFQISKHRTLPISTILNSNIENEIIGFIEYVWSSIREACSDIAMVSLNGMKMTDYMLFCIQCWFDNTPNINDLYAALRNDLTFHLRFALVAEYFTINKMEGWNLKPKSKEMFLDNSEKKYFKKNYAWFYISNKIKSADRSVRKEKYRELYNEADLWIDFFADCKKQFDKDYAVYYDEIFSCILSDFDVMLKINKCEKEYGLRLSEIRNNFAETINCRYINIINVLPSDLSDVSTDSVFNIKYRSEHFKQDLYTSTFFQKQKTLKELAEINTKIKNSKSNNNLQFIPKDITILNYTKKLNNNIWEIHIHSLTELLFYLKYCINNFNKTALGLKMRNTGSVWFRGHSSEGYPLIPTVMRKLDFQKLDKFFSMRSYQQNEFEEFKFRADGATEIPTGVRFTQSDYIALMQHYNVPTNFLDWSENAFSSLYFALKYYFQYPDKNERIRAKKDRNPTLLLFHPGIYNTLRRNKFERSKLFIQSNFKDIANQDTLGKLIDDITPYSNLIPNLSTRENESLFNMFIIGDIKYDKFYIENKDYFTEAVTKNTELQDLFLPLAVWTSRLNSRIRAQSGCFVAFNLYAPPLGKDEKKFFDYISLETIQKNNIDKDIFLYKLIIDKNCCDDIVSWLKAMGVSNETVYPELDQLKGRFE